MKRQNKYGNKKCRLGKLSFDSQLERDRWLVLKDFERRGIIKKLAHQVRVDLKVNDFLVCYMILDFQYIRNAAYDKRIHTYEDCKGIVEKSWRIKQKLFEAIYGVAIKIITKKNLTEEP